MLLILILIKLTLSWAAIDYIPPLYEEVPKEPSGKSGRRDRCGEGSKVNHVCVSYYLCHRENNTVTQSWGGSTEGNRVIDIRIGANGCPGTVQVCCKKPSNSPKLIPNRTKPTLSYCGIRNPNGIDFQIAGNSDNEAEYGEFPWMVALIKKKLSGPSDTSLICGASLLAPRVLLTGAHCLRKFKQEEIKARAGEWDTQTTDERLPYQESDIAKVIVHSKFNSQNFFNDIALVVLKTPIYKEEHIGTICLPKQDEIIDSKDCIVTGWGKDVFGAEGKPQAILKKVTLPIVPKKKCEDELKTSKLGKLYKLDDSFTCAGGKGKDACSGDGGGPLVCPDPRNPKRYVQAGIVAYGVGCGEFPGVYTDVTKFRDWIDENFKTLNIVNKPYTD